MKIHYLLAKAIRFFLLGSLLSILFFQCVESQACSVKKAAVNIKNLKNESYSEKLALDRLINKTYQEARKSDAYQLSIPLLASALQGDDKLYREILPKLYQALEVFSKEDETRKAWLLGRILLAADTIGDNINSAEVKAELSAMLKEKSLPENAFSAWATGYLAGSDKNEYREFKEKMISSSFRLTNEYEKEKLAPKNNNKTTLQDLSTNAMWSWVMALQAAANAGDRQTFDLILEEMKKMTKQSSVSSALSKGLTPNDYPAWAYGIVRLAAATIRDKELYNELEQPYQDSLEASQKAGTKSEEILGQLNAKLAAVRICHCRG